MKEEFKSAEYSYAIKYTWRIRNFSRINTDYVVSDIFTGGDHKWKMKLYPKGGDKNDKISIYLNVADPATLPSGWTRSVKYSFSVISEIDQHTVKRETERVFDVKGNNWGWPSFMDLDELREVDKHFLVKDTITVRAEVSFNEEQTKEKPDIKEAESLSSFTEFETLFKDLQNDLQETTKHREEEIADARTIFKQCLSMDVTSFIRSGKAPELKKALSLLLTTKVIPDSKVDETNKFIANFDQRCEKYETAKRDLSEARDDEDSVGYFKTALKQLFSRFVPMRNQIEAVDSEISRQEKLLTESKANRVRLVKKLTELIQRASTSKQALLCAEKDMNLSATKKEEADKTVSEFHISWESLKELLSAMKLRSYHGDRLH